MDERKRRRGYWLLTYLIAFIGIAVLFYPFVSDLWNKWRDRSLVVKYEVAVAALPDEAYEELWAQAARYNAEHRVNVIQDAFTLDEDSPDSQRYRETLDPNGTGLMGILEIPKIGQTLPIYHGLSASVLEQGVGHMEGTSLPVGGTGTHSAMAAHRGLPGKSLFTDLDQMEPGDQFYLHILSETLAYRVEEILVVLPEETESLAIRTGEDLCTLVTCTPYGVNTHRLLVRGTRVPYSEKEQTQQAEERDVVRSVRNLPLKLLGLGLIAIIILVPILRLILDRRSRKGSAGTK